MRRGLARPRPKLMPGANNNRVGSRNVARILMAAPHTAATVAGGAERFILCSDTLTGNMDSSPS